ncbi:MAG: RNA polymerase sporulation sigma factor SigG [Clostridia bacterium]|nr:RNA polymerase sporulation sigma factor SigG [Clostridia bacterium]
MGNKVMICGINTSELPTLKPKEMAELMTRVKSGDKQAREKFIFCNMKLVLSVCKRFTDKKESLDDIFQIGCVGLIKAIDNFDTSLNVKFSTYAVPMIIGEIRRYLRDNTLVRVSRSMRDIAYRTLKSREKLLQERNSEPSLEDIAKDIEVPLNEVVCALDAVSDTVSLEEPIFNDGQDAVLLMDQIGDNKAVEEIQKIGLRQALEKLSEREKQILLMRYYIGKTQVEISEEIGISQAQVSRLEKNALEQIKKEL